MPTYQYKCEDCGVVFERFQHFSEDPIEICPECDGQVRRVIQPVGIIFKGSGFYVTDNKKSGALTSKVTDDSKASSEKSSSDDTAKGSTDSVTKSPSKDAKKDD